MPSRKKSNLSAISRDARRVRIYRAQLRQALSQLPRTEDCIPLSDEALQREGEMNEAVFAKFTAKNKGRLSREPIPQPKPKLRIQPHRNKRSPKMCLHCKSETSWHQDCNNIVEQPPLLRSWHTNIQVKEANQSLRAELVALWAQKQKSIKHETESDEHLQCPSGDNQPQENEFEDGIIQEQYSMVSVKSELIL